MTLIRLIVCLVAGLVLGTPGATAHDLGNQMSVHAFVKPEGNRLHLLLRIPLALLPNADLPKRGSGAIDLEHADEHLDRIATATAKAVEIRADGELLSPGRPARRFTPPSDRSFDSYQQALAFIEGPPLPHGIDVSSTKGYVDVHLEYPIRSDRSDFAAEFRMDRGFGDLDAALREKVIVDVRFLPPAGKERIYVLRADTGSVMLDPSWHQAAWMFIKMGIQHIVGGVDHLLFLLCLVVPFRRFGWNVVGVVTAFTVAHSITLISAAAGFVPAGKWFPPFVETLIAASIIYMAVENVVSPNLRRRWFVTGLFGLIHGFGFSFALAEELQFAGGHLVLSLLAFNVGIEIGQIAAVAAILPLLIWLARRPVASRYTALGVSVVAGLIASYWMFERLRMLASAMDADVTAAAARVIGVVLVVGGIGYWLFDRYAVRRRRPSPEEV